MRSGKIIMLLQTMDRQDQSIAAYFAWSAGGILSAIFCLVGRGNFKRIHGLLGCPIGGFHKSFDIAEFFLTGTLLHTFLYTLIHYITAVVAHVCHHPFDVLCDRNSEIPGNNFFLFEWRELYREERTEKADQAVF